MNIVQIDLENRSQTRDFLSLPFTLYRQIPQWVPPLAHEARAVLNRRRYPYFRHSEAAFLVAYDAAGAPVGRLAVLDNRHYNEFHQDSLAFFYLFECQPDAQAARALFETGFEWARGRGLTRIRGPKGFTPLNGLGLLVKGHEYRPAFGIPYNPPYYAGLVEGAGLAGVRDLVSGYMDRSARVPDAIHRLSARVQRRRGLHVAPFRTRRDLRAFVPRLRALYNNSLANTTGNVPLTEAEAQSLASQMLWFADPTLIKIVFKGDDPVGFVFAYPDVSAAVQRTQGRLFPLGFVDIYRELSRTHWVNLNGIGILPEYRGLGGTALLYSELAKTLIESRFQYADLVQTATDNDPIQRELRNFGVEFRKMHRVYECEL